MTRMVSIDGARLRELRTAAGLSQAKLAERAGVSRSYISEIERGRLAEVSQEVRSALGGALGDPAGLGGSRRRRIRGRIRAVPS